MKNEAFYMTSLKTFERKPIAMPEVNDDDVLIKVKAVGICGSDLHYYEKGNIGSFVVEFPFILGHEAAGEVVQVGKNVKKFKIGDRVCMEPGIPDYTCEDCLSGHYNLCKNVKFWATPPYDGCLCNYVSHPSAFTFKLPDNMSYVEGALIEPLAIGLHAANTVGVKLGQTVVIIGSGCIGLVSLLAAKAYGATRVIVADVLDKRLEKAREFGAETINSKEKDLVKEVMAMTNGKGADVVIDCAGFSQTMQQALDMAANSSTIGLVGMGADKLDGIPTGAMSCKELTIKSIFRYRNLYPTAINAVASGLIPLKSIVSHSFSFDETDKAFKICLENIKDVVKGVIEL